METVQDTGSSEKALDTVVQEPPQPQKIVVSITVRAASRSFTASQSAPVTWQPQEPVYPSDISRASMRQGGGVGKRPAVNVSSLLRTGGPF
ncbi:hypothetical protein AVEN_203647-1 [Araneus ventricosus]|uniref:Uncharacterized protein n=1 Tax=Araneus ventricosus TaxID=182803 RepID=A0A4Y2JDF5_ARAVE|nr:hypothetical protein AVEN_203647-1 [Araneus ventricosus]